MLAILLATMLAQQPVPDPASPAGIPFQRFTTVDRFGRTITFYVQREGRGPLALFILGSGAYSQFVVKDGRTLHAQGDFLAALRGRARLMFVEKVGVAFGAQTPRRGTAIGATEEFRREHTLERWVEALSVALRAARRLPGVDLTRTLVAGHSEGAQVAAAVAAHNDFVTDVACLAGGAGTQLYDSLRAARAGRLRNFGATPEEQTKGMLAQWRDIQQHASDPDRMWVGHSYPYWASFMPGSVVEELVRAKARAFVAQGSLDTPNAHADIDLVHATLLAKGRDIQAIVVEGADHGFQFPADAKRDGWREILERVVDWFLPATP